MYIFNHKTTPLRAKERIRNFLKVLPSCKSLSGTEIQKLNWEEKEDMITFSFLLKKESEETVVEGVILITNKHIVFSLTLPQITQLLNTEEEVDEKIKTELKNLFETKQS